jgi:hypothetical protein
MGEHPGAWTSLDWSVVVAESIRPLAGVDYPSRLAQLRAWFGTDADCLDYLDWLRVRREALLFRMEVRDHHRRVVVAAR